MISPALNPQDPQKTQILGLAFAASDLLFEVSDAGTVVFVLGAVAHLTGDSAGAFVGSDWSELVVPADVPLLATLIGGLRPGERQGPVPISLRPRGKSALARQATLSVFRLPQPGANISCALSIGTVGVQSPLPRDAHGLLGSDTFMAAAEVLLEQAEQAGLPVRLDLIELDGFAARLKGMDLAEAELVREQVASVFRAESYGGVGAAELAPDRFALVRDDAAPQARLVDRIQGVAGSRPMTAQLLLKGPSSQNIRAMRYALDRYIEDGPMAAAEGFMETVKRTVRDTGRFQAILQQRAFKLAFQPVVNLKTRALHHFEALSRFDDAASPAETIRLAEELGLIADFDMAVARGVASALGQAPSRIKIAVNISAASLMRPDFARDLLNITDSDRSLRPRMLLEITETQRLSDLIRANVVIGALRKAGHIVCLDDFGAGAASLDYLSRLEVDVVKIDGRYVKGLETRPKDTLILKHLAALCAVLGVTTVAEMIETEDTARHVGELGVELGQGWCFGAATADLVWPLPTEPAAARRAGAREQWG